MIPFGSYFEIS